MIVLVVITVLVVMIVKEGSRSGNPTLSASVPSQYPPPPLRKKNATQNTAVRSVGVHPTLGKPWRMMRMYMYNYICICLYRKTSCCIFCCVDVVVYHINICNIFCDIVSYFDRCLSRPRWFASSRVAWIRI